MANSSSPSTGLSLHRPEEALLVQYRALPPGRRRRFLQALLDEIAGPQEEPSPDQRWRTLAEAADALAVSKSQVSRYLSAGKLIGNGRPHRRLRVLRISVVRLMLCKAKRILTALMHDEDDEDDFNDEEAMETLTRIFRGVDQAALGLQELQDRCVMKWQAECKTAVTAQMNQARC
jgi:hypothetical protein